MKNTIVEPRIIEFMDGADKKFKEPIRKEKLKNLFLPHKGWMSRFFAA